MFRGEQSRLMSELRRNVFSYCLKRLVLLIMIGDFQNGGNFPAFRPCVPLKGAPPLYQGRFTSTGVASGDRSPTNGSSLSERNRSTPSRIGVGTEAQVTRRP